MQTYQMTSRSDVRLSPAVWVITPSVNYLTVKRKLGLKSEWPVNRILGSEDHGVVSPEAVCAGQRAPGSII